MCPGVTPLPHRLQVHHKQLIASRQHLALLHELDGALQARLASEHSTIGYNLAAMRCMQHALEQSDEGRFFAEALDELGKVLR